MNEKLKNILEEIKLGKRTNIKDVYHEISLEDYLSKDENGITFLEYLLKNNISPNIDILKNSIEAAYIFIENNHLLYFFKLGEEDLFKEINGKRFIDYLKEKKLITENIISSIKHHTEILDILIQGYNSWYYFGHLNKELVSKLIVPNESGEIPILKCINNEEIFKILIEKIDNPKSLIELLKKYNKYELIKYANEITLMNKVNEENTLFEELYVYEGIIPEKLENLPANVDFINFLRKYNLYIYLKNANEQVLLLEIEENKTLLEELIELIPIFEINKNVEINDIKTLQILKKLNKLNLVTNIDEYSLLTPVNEIFKEKSIFNKTLLEYLLDKGYNPLSNKYNIESTKIIQILCKKNRYDILEKFVNLDNLLIEIQPGILLIDKILENKANINFDEEGFNSTLIADKLYKHKRFDLLIKGNIILLLKNEIYFDSILEEIKNKKIKFDLNDFFNDIEDIDTYVKFYISIAKNDMMDYIKPLTKEELLEIHDDKTLLDMFLEVDSKLTFNEILPCDVKSDVEIATILLAKGYKYKRNSIDIPLKEKSFTKEYIELDREKYGIGPLYLEGIYLLEKLETLFNNDGKSDKELVKALISAYTEALIVNYSVNIQELRNLVKVKEENIDKFLYLKTEENSYFHEGQVYCNKNIIPVILHETGHALHYYLTNYKQPKELYTVMEKVRKNLKTIKKIQEFSFLYYRKRNDIKERIKKEFYEYFNLYFTEEKMNEIDQFLDKVKKDKYEEFKDLGIPLETLNTILNGIFTKEEYIEHIKLTFIKEKQSIYFSAEFSEIVAISDILDAIYNGEIYSGSLEIKDAERIKNMSGHGISYYYNGKLCFTELIANFSIIIKSRKSKEYINLLKSIIGEELFNLIATFYYENIVESKEIPIKNINILGGKNE